jgi:hypothetical protein
MPVLATFVIPALEQCRAWRRLACTGQMCIWSVSVSGARSLSQRVHTYHLLLDPTLLGIVLS